MTTYLHGSSSEIQADSASCSLQTLYLMTPNNYLTTATSSTGYSDTPHHVLHPTQSHHHQYIMNPGGDGGGGGGSLLLLNSPHFLGVNPHLPAVIGSKDLNRSFSSSSSSSSHHRLHYNNMWGGIGILSSTDHHHHRSSSIPTGTTTTAATGTHQGLSLSLSYHRQLQAAAAGGGGSNINIMDIDTSASNGRDIVMGSKYLKAAQQLLDEVVKVVGKGINGYQLAEEGELAGKVTHQDHDHQSTTDHDHIREEGSGGGENTEKQQRGHHDHDNQFTSTAQRQELQMKKAKLVNMLDEVEQRYKQYHNQMQIVVSSFEEAAGTGSTKSYTSLALQTISKQFRCLKDAIASQIKAVAGSLGDQDHDGSTKVLKFVDQQLRQQRALHQIGTIIMPQHNHHMNNAWRPQRGLPESAVSVLRAWLFEHFLHPYPKDSDKHMLAKQTGLTRSQVSNWFINARVRLWKPMVEEMYLEEMKQHDQENNNNTIITDGELLPNKELLLAAAGESKSEISPQIRVDHDHHQTNSNNSIDHDVIINKYPSTFHLEQHQILRSPTPNDHHVYSSPKKAKPFLENNDNINGGNGFGTYNPLIMISTDDDQMGHHDHDHDQFDHHGAGFHDFLSSQMVQTSHYGGMMTSTSSNSAPHSSNIIMNINNNGTYETMISSSSTAMAINNNRKRFAAPLLPDFVA